MSDQDEKTFIDTTVTPALDILFKECKKNGVSIVCRVEMYDEKQNKAIAAEAFLPSKNLTTHQMTIGNIINEKKLFEFVQAMSDIGFKKAQTNQSNILLPGKDF